MRTLGMLLLGAGLLVPGLGCASRCQHTAGVCDCYPPPVQSLLVAPTPAHPSLGVYGGVATTPAVADAAKPAPVQVMPQVVAPAK